MTKRKGPWEGERNFHRERETSEYEAGSVTKINYNALVFGRGGGEGGIEEIVTIFSLM